MADGTPTDPPPERGSVPTLHLSSLQTLLLSACATMVLGFSGWATSSLSDLRSADNNREVAMAQLNSEVKALRLIVESASRDRYTSKDAGRDLAVIDIRISSNERKLEQLEQAFSKLSGRRR